ncbi:uncharacterized protein LOC110839719 [Zootermopsis nevadensis]|uniref:Kazal-like domain-containing protein n=1 Tax=Zootermopsis nevadensis TaxID=136037 RepID=A0A067RHE9_ZOONE|nr:uncharacterized protein LOC110839719 [Zootermopsis nevadensis]KDR23286.1 hypothetical protein L798_15593 [Zootermopsis nevadensis]
MCWAVITWTAIIATKLLQTSAYGHAGAQDNSRPPALGFKENFSWGPDFFYPKERERNVNANNFRPRAPTGGIPRNSLGRRRQLGGGVNSRPDLFLPPAADDPDDIYIFDGATSPRPRPGGSEAPLTTPSTTTTAANCDCPSTPEFNPVCGSDALTYTNPGKLKCAIFCGTDVALKHYGSCLSTTAPQTTTGSSQ